MLSAFFLPAVLLITTPLQLPVQSAQSSTSPDLNFDQIALDPDSSQSGTPVCLKMRVYQFERNDGMAPKLVRETTCTSTRPFLHKTKAPKARLVPAD